MRRRLANWSTQIRWRSLDGVLASPALKSAICLVPRTRRRKSAKAVTCHVLTKLLATYRGDGLRDVRDRAILMVAFGAGGRRRSELALRVEQLTHEDPVTTESDTALPALFLRLGRTKTSGGDQNETVDRTGRPVDALNAWLRRPRSTPVRCFEESIAGAMSAAALWMDRRAAPSSNDT
jgi:site-specific recombinase XerC